MLLSPAASTSLTFAARFAPQTLAMINKIPIKHENGRAFVAAAGLIALACMPKMLMKCESRRRHVCNPHVLYKTHLLACLLQRQNRDMERLTRTCRRYCKLCSLLSALSLHSRLNLRCPRTFVC